MRNENSFLRDLCGFSLRSLRLKASNRKVREGLAKFAKGACSRYILQTLEMSDSGAAGRSCACGIRPPRTFIGIFLKSRGKETEREKWKDSQDGKRRDGAELVVHPKS
jgi:hypothetical protein